MKEPQILVENLSVSYNKQKILSGINFAINRGEFISIVGKSGCGKSTLLHALAGFIPSEGNIFAPKHIGVVFQNYAIFPWLTIEENFAFGLGRMEKEHKKGIIKNYLDLMSLSDHAHKYPAQLSGGQKQRVAIATAMAPNPDVVLMDEPFGALDRYTRDKMQTWLLELWETHRKTVLFVTHDIEEALFLSDRVFVLTEQGILNNIPVPFSRPRIESVKFTLEFIELKKQITEMLNHQAII